jgi:RNase P subunit RPR2
MSISNKAKAASQERLSKLANIASAAGSLGGAMDEETQALLKRSLEKILKEDAASEAAIIASRRAHLDSIREDAETVRRTQANCSHLKQDRTSTRLGGQRVGAPGQAQQIALVCSSCGKEYHFPVKEGQEAPPQHLIPEMDMIGGQLT